MDRRLDVFWLLNPFIIIAKKAKRVFDSQENYPNFLSWPHELEHRASYKTSCP